MHQLLSPMAVLASSLLLCHYNNWPRFLMHFYDVAMNDVISIKMPSFIFCQIADCVANS